jgi:dihydrofolate reductase
MKGIIVAVSRNGVIGKDNRIPWHYPADLKRFKRLTQGHTVIMGRLTYESIGKPLPNRRNVVIGRTAPEGVETFSSLDAALASTSGDVWFIGGERIFREAMPLADTIDVTYVPDVVEGDCIVMMPAIDEARFAPGPLLTHEDDPRLQRRVYSRRN